jgi:hypothetical protein
MRGRGWRQELKLRKTVEERRRDTSHVEMASRSVFDSEKGRVNRRYEKKTFFQQAKWRNIYFF